MRVGLWSYDHVHAPAYLRVLRQMEGVALVCATDQDPERGARLSQEYGVPFVPDPDALLAQVDAVVITSANADHLPMCLRAAQAGLAVLLEKPIATTLADAHAIVDAFARADLTLATAFPCPFSPAYATLQQRVDAGDLGRVLACKTTNRGSMPGGFFVQLERSGGGAIIDHSVHVADLLRRLTHSEATRVYAEIGHGLYHQAWDDSGFLTIEYVNGTFATLDCSWSRPKSYPTWGDVTLKVVGERGNAAADLFGQRLNLYPAPESRATWLPWGSDLDGLMVADFVAAVRERRPPRSTGEDGLAALKVALAAYESERTGQPVSIA